MPNKQEEIREGMAELLCGYGTDVRVAYAERKGGSARYTRTDKILSYLHSRGVVIQVEREWDIGETATHGIPCNPLCHNMERKLLKDAGYIAVEPLIKER